ncbi:MAG: hypothetical protein IJW25_01350 [Clostridia bacterium]|nr:hypothetical protein [Clostridia bacterium]
MKNLHAIDHGIVLYGETASKVLKSVNYPSILCKTNNWTGIQIKQLQSNGSNYKFKYNFKKALIYTIAPFKVALLMLIIRLAVGFKMFLTLEILYWAVFFLILVVGLVFASKLVVKSSIGDNVRDKAKYL